MISPKISRLKTAHAIDFRKKPLDDHHAALADPKNIHNLLCSDEGKPVTLRSNRSPHIVLNGAFMKIVDDDTHCDDKGIMIWQWSRLCNRDIKSNQIC